MNSTKRQTLTWCYKRLIEQKKILQTGSISQGVSCSFHSLDYYLNSATDSNKWGQCEKCCSAEAYLAFHLGQAPEGKKNQRIDLLQRHQLESLRHLLANLALKRINKLEKKISLLPHSLGGAKLSSSIMSKKNGFIEFKFLILCFKFSFGMYTHILVHVYSYIINI